MNLYFCKYRILPEAAEAYDITPFEGEVTPLSLEFYLERGAPYLVLCTVGKDSDLWVHATPVHEKMELLFFPACLLDFSGKIEAPASLLAIKNWRELFYDDDERVVAIVNAEMRLMMQEYKDLNGNWFVRINGFQTGYRTKELAMLVHQSTHIDFETADLLAEKLRDGFDVSIEFANESVARAFASSVESLGVNSVTQFGGRQELAASCELYENNA